MGLAERPLARLFFCFWDARGGGIKMRTEPETKRAVAFFDGQNLSETADEIRSLAEAKDRWTSLARAFPVSPTCDNRRGIDRDTYDACLDPDDYRMRLKP